ncbi:hypothetical protein O4G76_16035 [Limimaricola sp. G21655-S1]|uniref:hypothetical protein n=1 Tax=Limimaricola sp. G21655-S1 TaxID=3014768 RepID=UPI0022AEA069|nr:hypothetical protein [Limimaricola sp. G21655-S1]MCZ4262351.1 hypothetical protein [Limimaricola sp. G21655-S1]
MFGAVSVVSNEDQRDRPSFEDRPAKFEIEAILDRSHEKWPEYVRSHQKRIAANGEAASG